MLIDRIEIHDICDDIISLNQLYQDNNYILDKLIDQNRLMTSRLTNDNYNETITGSNLIEQNRIIKRISNEYYHELTNSNSNLNMHNSNSVNNININTNMNMSNGWQ